MENFKLKCAEVEKQLVTFNFEQLQARFENEQPVYPKKRTYKKRVNNRSNKGCGACPKAACSNKAPRKNRKNQNISDQQIQIPEQLKQIHNINFFHQEATVHDDNENYPGSLHNISNYQGLSENQVFYNPRPQGTGTFPVRKTEKKQLVTNVSDMIRENWYNHSTRFRLDPIIKQSHQLFDNSEEICRTQIENSNQNPQICFRESVIQPNRILNYNKRSQGLIDRFSEEVNKVQEYDASPQEEQVIDLAELISSQLNEDISNINNVSQENQIVETDKRTRNIEHSSELARTINNNHLNNSTANVADDGVIEIQSDTEVELNDFSTIGQEYSDDCEDDIFEEGKITIVKNEVEQEENPR